MESKFSQAEIVSAVIEAINASPEDDGTVTTKELCKILGRGPKSTRKILENLIEDGTVEPCQSTRKSILNGKVYTVDAYRKVDKGEQ